MGERSGLSRRQMIRAGAAALAAALGPPAARVASAQRASQRDAGAEELVFVNGRIHTMDRNNTVANTVSIRNGRFTSVGGAAPSRAPGVRIVDLRGRTVVPGIIDNHNHI